MYAGCATMKDGSVKLFCAEDIAEAAAMADKYMHSGACRVDIAQTREGAEADEG